MPPGGNQGQDGKHFLDFRRGTVAQQTGNAQMGTLIGSPSFLEFDLRGIGKFAADDHVHRRSDQLAITVQGSRVTRLDLGQLSLCIVGPPLEQPSFEVRPTLGAWMVGVPDAQFARPSRR